MKRTLITLIIACCTAGAFAQKKTTTISGTVTVTTDSAKTDSTKKKKSFEVTIGERADSAKARSKRPGVSFDVTFARFDLGFSKLVDNGSFTLSPANNFLEYKSSKTSNVGFDVLQFGYRFTSHFKIYLSGGFDWTHIRLQKDITILQDQPSLSYKVDAPIEYKKNRFSSSYLRVPLSFDLRTNDDKQGKKFHFVFGPEAGFLLNGKVKQVSGEDGKQKFKDDYHFTQFRYGAFARIGYGGAGLYVKHYFNDMFENSPAQSGLKNMAFGLMIGF